MTKIQFNLDSSRTAAGGFQTERFALIEIEKVQQENKLHTKDKEKLI